MILRLPDLMSCPLGTVGVSVVLVMAVGLEISFERLWRDIVDNGGIAGRAYS